MKLIKLPKQERQNRTQIKVTKIKHDRNETNNQNTSKIKTNENLTKNETKLTHSS